MRVKIAEMPQGKSFSDYPEDTEFVLEDNFPSLFDEIPDEYKKEKEDE